MFTAVKRFDGILKYDLMVTNEENVEVENEEGPDIGNETVVGINCKSHFF